MKTYYLTVEENLLGNLEVRISDVRRGKAIMEISAESYADACKKVSFHMHYAGHDGVLMAKDAKIITEVI